MNDLRQDVEPPIAGMKTIPLGLPVMRDAWIGFLHFACKSTPILEQYREQTGVDMVAIFCNRSPLDGAIDEVTGRDRKLFIDFVDWLNREHWGTA